ncbi:MAG: ketopantoate reductase family protein [Sedimentibacter sp.]|nr:ketopantoate reductase family protein [Sedimentibacter sp.]
MKINNVALIGMGAVGTVYGNILNNHFGNNFAVISDASRKEKLLKQGFTLNGKTFHTNVLSNGLKELKMVL